MKRFNCNVICEDEQGEYVRYEDVKDLLDAQVQRMQLKDGDIVVFKHPAVLSMEEVANITRFAEEGFRGAGYNVKVMVLQEGMDVTVLTKEDD